MREVYFDTKISDDCSHTDQEQTIQRRKETLLAEGNQVSMTEIGCDDWTTLIILEY